MASTDDVHDRASGTPESPGTLGWLRAVLADRAPLADPDATRRAILFARVLAAALRATPDRTVDDASSRAMQSYLALRGKLPPGDGAPATSTRRPGVRPSGNTPTYRYAIATAFVALVAVAGVLVTTRIQHRPTVERSSRHYATSASERREITLPDGSRVMLDRSSTLTITSDFGVAHRQVLLSGEAYFTVTHHTAAPFIVTTGNATARVLGTSFMVRKYPGDHVANIVVSDGRVLVTSRIADRATPASVILDARMRCAVGDSGALSVQRDVPVDDYTAWMRGQLVFHGTPLREVVAELERLYGVRIHVADTTLFAQRVTLTVSTTTESLAQVLDAFTPVIDAHYTRSDSLITIMPGRRVNRAAPSPRVFPLGLEKSYGR